VNTVHGVTISAGIAHTRSKPEMLDYHASSLLTRKESLPWLTLITCRGYDSRTGTYLWRTAVRAVLVSVK